VRPIGGDPGKLSTRADLPITEINVGGKILRLLVDTGTDRMMLFGARSAAEISPNTGQQSSVRQQRRRRRSRSAPFRRSISKSAESASIKNAYFVPDNEEPLFDGLLSVRSLGIRVLSLDANRRIVYLLK